MDDEDSGGETEGTPLPVHAPESISSLADVPASSEHTNIKTTNSACVDPNLRVLDNVYRGDCKAPYIVHLERIGNNSNTSDNTNILQFSNALRRIAPRYIDQGYDLKRTGPTKFKTSFSNHTSANSFVKFMKNKAHSLLRGEEWIVYIPDYKVIKKMIIRGFEDGPEPADIIKYVRPPPLVGTIYGANLSASNALNFASTIVMVHSR